MLDGRIWVRNYQIIVPGGEQRQGKSSLDDMSLAEVGPRMCLNPIKIFSGSHSGASLYSNASFMTPTAMRVQARKHVQDKYANKVRAREERKEYVDNVVKRVKDAEVRDGLRNVFKRDHSDDDDEDDDNDKEDGGDVGADVSSDGEDSDFSDGDNEFDGE